MRFGFGLDDVGTGTCVAVECPDPVVIERVRSQASDVLTGSADNQIVVYVTAKSTARGYVQAVTGRTADTCPVRSEVAGSLIGVV